jgi:hypothetical protein
MTRHPCAHLVVVALAGACGAGMAAAPQAPDIESLMTSIGNRVAESYRRAQGVICLERSVVQPIESNLAPAGFPRTVESDLRVEFGTADGDMLPQAKVIREPHRINGRAPRERDSKDRSGCTDPNPLSPEPLAFLLPAHRDEHLFTSLKAGREKDRAALIIDFKSTNRKSKLELIEDERGHDDCFDWSGPLATRGRVWVDARTHDVLRVDRRLDGPVDVRVPLPLQRRHNLPQWVVLERDDQTMRYRAVAFREPDEVMQLPESIESLTVLHGGLQSMRRTETFSEYRGSLIRGRVKHP